MSRAKNEIDEYGKQLLSPLRSVPPLDPQIAAAKKENFLLQAERYRQEVMEKSTRDGDKVYGEVRGAVKNNKSFVFVKALVGALLALFILLGSGASVYASQNSLPGDPLYLIKSLGEDIRLSITSSPESRLELTLDYTDRRLYEITTLISDGKELPTQASERFSRELENALLLASKMDDPQMKIALGRIKILAKDQGMTIEDLISMLPDQAAPAIIRLRERLVEQIELSTFGETDPQAFRSAIRERERQRHQPGPHKPTSESDDSTINPTEPPGTPDKTGNGHDNGEPTEVPGNHDSGPGQGNPNPGNGNKQPEKTQAP